jgi:transcriptional regulator with XRE-family HTH domain
LKLSQRKLEKIAKISQATISDLESQKHNPTPRILKKYLESIGIEFENFIKDKRYVKKIKHIYVQAPKKTILKKEEAYILGVLGPGDGSISKNGFKLGAKDKDFIEEFCKMVQKCYKLTPHIYFDKYYKILHAVVCARSFVNYFHFFNVSFKEKNWRIPKTIFSSNNEIKRYYLRGIFDSQGSVNFVEKSTKNVNLRSYNKRGLRQIKKLLIQLGIKSSILDKGRRLYLFGRNNIEKFQNLINFSIKRKRLVLESLINSYERNRTSPRVINTLVNEMKELRGKKLTYLKIATEINKKYNLSISRSCVQGRLKGE